jgi:hypothetical protein
VGLVWTERCPARNWDGRDTRGVVYAQVIGFAGHYGACINTIGCGAKRGIWVHGDSSAFATPEDAMDAADRHVTAYVDALWCGGVELRHPDTPP